MFATRRPRYACRQCTEGVVQAAAPARLITACPQGDSARTAIEQVGATLLLLPPYSSDFNPIEQAFAKLKALLRRASGRTLAALESTIADALDAFTPAECANYFTNSGHEPD